jgi:hypothetical protein
MRLCMYVFVRVCVNVVSMHVCIRMYVVVMLMVMVMVMVIVT